jgi:hypothetical protein
VPPQHSDLNQRTWLQLENAVLSAARDNKVKVSVLTGPVLSPQDPTVRGVQVPTAFWKIVAYRAGGRLRAHGFMQWQTELVDDVRRRFEAFDELGAAAQYQVPIRDIARDTSLDFGPLIDADDEELQPAPARGGGGGGGGRRRRRRAGAGGGGGSTSGSSSRSWPASAARTTPPAPPDADPRQPKPGLHGDRATGNAAAKLPPPSSPPSAHSALPGRQNELRRSLQKVEAALRNCSNRLDGGDDDRG